MARPKKKIDPAQVRKLAAIQCSYDEMAAVLGCDPSTLTRRFAQAIKEGRDHGRMSLRRKQYEMALNGNVTMLVWLGKQYLSQRDKHEVTEEISYHHDVGPQPIDLSEVSTIEIMEALLAKEATHVIQIPQAATVPVLPAQPEEPEPKPKSRG